MKKNACLLSSLGCLLLVASLGLGARAQVLDSATGTLPGGEVEHNKRLRIVLDRTTFRAFEPIYLAVSAEHFVSDARPEVSVWQGNAQPQPVAIDEKAWVTGEGVSMTDQRTERQGVLVQLRVPAPKPGDKRIYLFPTPGDYNMRVKVGPDAATLKLKVIPTEDRERDAWDRLGNQLEAIVYNGLADHPKQITVDTCTGIMRTFPGTVCAGYCQAYMSVAKFKVAFDKSGKTGGKAAYDAIAKELLEVHQAFGETFLGEQTGFYAAYAMGLTKDFDGMMKLAEGVKSRVTPFSDGIMAMRMEVLEHRGLPIPVDPATLASPTTAPAAPK